MQWLIFSIHNSVARSCGRIPKERTVSSIFALTSPSLRARHQLPFNLALNPPLLPNTCCSFSAQLRVYSLVTKLRQIYVRGCTQQPCFQHFPNFCAILASLRKSSPCYQRLTNSLCALLPLFARPIFCFQRFVNSLAKNTGGMGVSAIQENLKAGGKPSQSVPAGRDFSSALIPFQTICTPMQTSKNEVSWRITVMPVVPSTRPSRSAKL
jgi:hypothetical protein